MDALMDLIAVQLAITFVGSLSVYAIWEMHVFLRINHLRLFAIIAGQAAAHDPVQTPGTMDTTHSKSLACNYIGTLFGTFAFLFVLAPNVGLGMAAWWTASFNLLGAIALLALIPSHEVLGKRKKQGHRILVAGMVPALAALIVVGLREDKAEQLALKAGYYVHTKDAAQPGNRPPRNKHHRSQTPCHSPPVALSDHAHRQGCPVPFRKQ
jgi:predicted membrane-bound spermidine synthase